MHVLSDFLNVNTLRPLSKSHNNNDSNNRKYRKRQIRDLREIRGYFNNNDKCFYFWKTTQTTFRANQHPCAARENLATIQTNGDRINTLGRQGYLQRQFSSMRHQLKSIIFGECRQIRRP